MTILEFIAKIVDSLVWPATVILIFWHSRGYIRRLLPLISKVRYKELEVEFERLLEQTTPQPPALPSPEKKVIDDTLATAAELADTEPSAGIIFAWQVLEKELLATMSVLQPSTKAAGLYQSRTQTIDILREQDLITTSEADNLHRLRRLRNEVVHIAQTRTIVPKEVAMKYAEECHALAARLKQIQSKVTLHPATPPLDQPAPRTMRAPARL